MPGVGFETTITMFERAKTFHDSDHAFTATGKSNLKTQIPHTSEDP
jgi:hypothetical protein